MILPTKSKFISVAVITFFCFVSISIAADKVVVVPLFDEKVVGDNWGSQTVHSDATLIGDGTAAVPLKVVGDLSDDQTLSLSGNDLSISNGNTIWIPSSGACLWGDHPTSASVYYNGSSAVLIGTDEYNGAIDKMKLKVISTGASGQAIRAESNSSLKATLYVKNNGTGPAADFRNRIRIADGSEGTGRILTSDDNGNGTWQSIGIDDLSDGSASSFSLYIGPGAGAVNSGDFNTAVGFESLNNSSSGEDNTAFGFKALHTNTSGDHNTAIGTQALFENETGINNTAVGSHTLWWNVSGHGNTAVGNHALSKNDECSYNVAIGVNALRDNSTYATEDYHANENTAVGNESLILNTTGYGNTAVGFKAMHENKSGRYNTAIGYETQMTDDDLHYTVAIGYKSIAHASNRVRIGGTNILQIGGQVGWSILSDGRFKRNIKENVPGLRFIRKLRPVTYTKDLGSLNDFSGIEFEKEQDRVLEAIESEVCSGFIAQEVEKAALEVGYDFSAIHEPENEKDTYTLKYAEFVVPLVKAVQELEEDNTRLKSKIDEQNKSIELLLQRIKKIEAMCEKI